MSKKLSKTPKLNTIWLETIARVLNMSIELKGNNYYSRVFKRVNYKLQNSTFWVVISTYINYTYKTSLIYIHGCIYITNFAKDVQMVPKCVSRWGSTMNPFRMGCQIKLWSIHVQMGVLEALGSDVPNLMKDVPNFIKDVPRSESAFRSGDWPPTAYLWVSKWNRGPSMFKWRSQNLSDRMYQI